MVELWTILGLSGGRKRRQNGRLQQERPQPEEEEEAEAAAELSFYETTTYQGDIYS